MSVSWRTKSAREAVADIDYKRKLGPAEAEWLDTYMRATVNNDLDAMADLVGQDPRRLARLQHAIYAEDNAKRRDITYVGTRIDVADDMDGEHTAAFAQGSVAPEFEAIYRCRRCLKRTCECGPRFRIQIKQYDQADYAPRYHSEDVAISEMDLARRMDAFDLLPYGDSPEGLEVGHTVRICLPHHLLNKALGYILAYRAVSGEYLIRSVSKEGLRNKDGSRPRATVLYVRPEALKRARPELVKAFETSPDKRNNGGNNA